MREFLNILLSDHTPPQKANYIKYLVSGKKEILNYDPLTISIVATSRCTLSCDMCPTHSSRVDRSYLYIQKNLKDMDLEMFRYIVDRFKNATTIHIIGSGEPLLNKDFFTMADYAASKNMKVKTFSNGTMIEHNIDNILKSKLDGITISINGHNGNEFKRMTGMGGDVYNKIYDAAKKLIAEKKKRGSKVKVKLSFIIDRHNYRFIPDMVKMSIDMGVDHIFLCNFLPAPYEGLNASERVLTLDDNVVNELKDIFANFPLSVRKKITPPVLVNMKSLKHNCDTHFTQIRFDGDGNVSSCSMMLLDMTGHGNYKDRDVWNNEFFKRMRRLFLKGRNEEFPEPCRACPDNKGVNLQDKGL